ncbi:MAG: lipoyl(octanoyl) transferase LipB, partial [Terriglobales bacterium]
VASDEQLLAAGVEVFECDRGGDVTYHGPGQLMGYPILDLRGFSPPIGAVEFVRRIEEVLIRTCAEFGIAVERVAGMTGVWTRQTQAKIAAIGVHISRAVTSHGFALNVNTNLGHFDLIVPCGLTAKPVTSMFRELGVEMALEEVARAVARNFGQVFGVEVRWVESLDALANQPVGVPLRAPEELRRLRGEEDTWA